jgi:hypothetical protein
MRINKVDIFYLVMFVVQVSLVVLRINEVFTFSWWFVFTPVILPSMIFIFLWFGMFTYFFIRNIKDRHSLKSRLREVIEAKEEAKDILKELDNE